LKRYEAGIAGKAMFLAVSERDAAIYRAKFHAKVEHLPVFLPWDTVEPDTGKGQFCLYHGNLSVIENEIAALWLLQKVFKELKMPFIIAGKNPSTRLEQAVNGMEHVRLVVNPSEAEMQDLIRKAHINVLPVFNITGVKLKLLNALFVGRHCITNIQAVQGTGMESCCHIINTVDEIKAAIKTLLQEELTPSTIAERARILSRTYNKEINCSKLIEWIW
jgi:hypothetical protein